MDVGRRIRRKIEHEAVEALAVAGLIGTCLLCGALVNLWHLVFG